MNKYLWLTPAMRAVYGECYRTDFMGVKMKDSLHVLFVCGYGVGSSLMSEMVVSKALKEAGVKCKLEHTSVGEMQSMLSWCDIVAISKKLIEGIDQSSIKDKHFIEIINVMDGKGIAAKIKAIAEQHYKEFVQ